MACLRRHQLASLTGDGWAAILQRPWGGPERECLTHWATHRLPLVVTRQSVDADADGCIALGLSCPARWGRRRLTLQSTRAAVLCVDEFPRLAELLGLLPLAAQRPVRQLLNALDACGATAHVFGSYGWQAISGLTYMRPTSDVDLWIAVDGMEQADVVAQGLQSYGPTKPRLDGELVFNDGAAVAWREWVDWRAGRVRTVMVKRMEGVAVLHDGVWGGRHALAEAVK